MDYDAFMEIVRNTRSIRRFRPDPVPDDSIDKIIEAGRWAPSGFNQQPWEFVVVKDAAYRGKIAGWYGEYMAQTRTMETTREGWQKAWDPEPTGSAADFSVAPVYILLLGDTRTKPGLPMSMRYNPARQEYIFTASLANAFLYMHMAPVCSAWHRSGYPASPRPTCTASSRTCSDSRRSSRSTTCSPSAIPR